MLSFKSKKRCLLSSQVILSSLKFHLSINGKDQLAIVLNSSAKLLFITGDKNERLFFRRAFSFEKPSIKQGLQLHTMYNTFDPLFCLFAFIAAMTTYEVNVATGDVKGAGTDANVYLTLYGEASDTGSCWLTKNCKQSGFRVVMKSNKRPEMLIFGK